MTCIEKFVIDYEFYENDEYYMLFDILDEIEKELE